MYDASIVIFDRAKSELFVLMYGGHSLDVIPLESEHLALLYDVHEALKSSVRSASKFRRTFHVWKVVTVVTQPGCGRKKFVAPGCCMSGEEPLTCCEECL